MVILLTTRKIRTACGGGRQTQDYLPMSINQEFSMNPDKSPKMLLFSFNFGVYLLNMALVAHGHFHTIYASC